ncbi:hypothetical protein [Qipengyuania aquimaris]|uniref:Uncharacterized protein n=1 Tax=Qipengyuania aquimaris TaxID=255984 RepID=A0A9Q3S0H4_9SPHN|nr:hypothetical protein [Qipengyuania aquimaris]MBY6217707.1 hypothetical protein [Qipengyuania aquimaris]
MKKLAIALAASALVTAAPISAGEVNGNGGFVPGGVNGASECSFSGLNDDLSDGLGFTQTFAAVFRLFGLHPRFFNPGEFCRG